MIKPLFLTSILLGLSLACSSSHDAPAPEVVATAATGLAYTDPAGSGWRLVKDASSTSSRLVLNLVGPSGLKTRGAAFNLRAPATVKFGNFTESGWPIADAGVYELWNTDPMGDGSVAPGKDPLEPRLFAGGVQPGHVLTVGIFQKDRRATAKESGQPLCRIALEFDAAANLKAGDALALTITKARHMAEDIGAFSTTVTYDMAAKSHLVDMNIAVGTLSAK